MIIHGLQKMTLVDYPGKVAAILFTGSCDFRCPFCQNASLVLDPSSEPEIPEEEIFSYLEKRKGMLEGVVMTGGEPTVHSDLLEYMDKIKNLGYSVKLDTNGYRPDVLKKAVLGGYADYVAMDVKNSLSKYAQTAGIKHLFTPLIEESISFLKEGHVPYEFRTTVVHELHSDEDFDSIGKMCEGAERFYLQTFSNKGDIIEEGLTPPSPDDMERYIMILRKYIKNVSLRDR
ncbi:MAG: anaerobic ribonucleoside-triphosphate reductase activating protein [Spirochaetes bacterium]|uniref:Anaerobic ribonucleoside-triphosphate reductase activating protein n=1 Tax=Candidatus Ornithospirochaeta stercoripullorum TaxID=2840899 RepID=A0A9D9E030_9SPIO|nr:anaerobic ribonucleoside-triphosphate reductase activating protein [Candidatus Ornithospirochaeta stercoripullorum]